ncbi:uncharacterized protein LOC132753985 [Ruditapes philippinarum]|uniref:uncharacterized protein LOC132753985 n=1 Tax=Ruditapes philippinarum TaxID=129788 RepID=UPI00295B0A53|nr:uncharacterized protein LOC132753985 [Ruditapes philippinarum]
MCICKDRCIIMTDYTNKCIKKMNDSFQIISSLNVTDNPVGICQIDSSLLAVTLINDMAVQFISQKEPMKLQQSFKVGNRCRGIAYNDKMLYVCCGGIEDHEGVGHLEVYSLSGALLTSYYGEIELPTRVAISSSAAEIFVIDGYKGILHIDKNQRFIPVDNKASKSTGCICKINKSQFCVAFCNSHNILLMARDGKVQVELLRRKDGIINPIGLCFDNKTSRLLVSCFESDNIMVYTLKISN